VAEQLAAAELKATELTAAAGRLRTLRSVATAFRLPALAAGQGHSCHGSGSCTSASSTGRRWQPARQSVLERLGSPPQHEAGSSAAAAAQPEGQAAKEAVVIPPPPPPPAAVEGQGKRKSSQELQEASSRRPRSSSRDDGARHRDTGEGRGHHDRHEGGRQEGRQTEAGSSRHHPYKPQDRRR